mmetsp:Transcript_95019/g.306788  ORF Transcript_95019/g.306788 Transcript_95019/m.306788 type:complete len:234 (-) Transcript_95019:40-741(-)
MSILGISMGMAAAKAIASSWSLGLRRHLDVLDLGAAQGSVSRSSVAGMTGVPSLSSGQWAAATLVLRPKLRCQGAGPWSSRWFATMTGTSASSQHLRATSCWGLARWHMGTTGERTCPCGVRSCTCSGTQGRSAHSSIASASRQLQHSHAATRSWAAGTAGPLPLTSSRTRKWRQDSLQPLRSLQVRTWSFRWCAMANGTSACSPRVKVTGSSARVPTGTVRTGGFQRHVGGA